MSAKPPRAAVGLVELFAPIESTEGVLGDLEEEFVARLARSGHRAARGWFWRQALRTAVHLLWGAVRAAPWSTTAQALASFVVASLLYGVASGWVSRLVSNLPSTMTTLRSGHGEQRAWSGSSPFLSHSAGRSPSSCAAGRW